MFLLKVFFLFFHLLLRILFSFNKIGNAWDQFLNPFIHPWSPVCPKIFKFSDEEQSTGGESGYQVPSCSYTTASLLLPVAKPVSPSALLSRTFFSSTIFQFAKFSRTGTAFTTVAAHCISNIINVIIIVEMQTDSQVTCATHWSMFHGFPKKYPKFRFSLMLFLPPN